MTSTISWVIGEAAVFSTVDWGQFVLAIGENAHSAKFFEPPEASQYDEGVAFGPQAELRWKRRANGLFHLVWIQDGAPDPADPWVFRALVPLPLATPPRRVYLWSEKDGRIPAALSYPLAAAGARLAARIRHYRLEVEAPAQTDRGIEPVTVPARLYRYLRLEKTA